MKVIRYVGDQAKPLHNPWGYVEGLVLTSWNPIGLFWKSCDPKAMWIAENVSRPHAKVGEVCWHCLLYHDLEQRGLELSSGSCSVSLDRGLDQDVRFARNQSRLHATWHAHHISIWGNSMMMIVITGPLGVISAIRHHQVARPKRGGSGRISGATSDEVFRQRSRPSVAVALRS